MKKYRASIFGGPPRREYGVYKSGRRTKKRDARRGTRKNRGIAALLSLLMVFAGVGLLGYSMLGAGSAVAGVIRATVGGAEAPESTSMK
ncbi:MAG: hypothetical protein ACRDSJ_22005, partial [Rubrobacteraceae bacterium]